ncbi:hypothetical protein Thimo_2219 [Thioflavicoccus mobilis 8321]|uniref:Thioredoxin domain-containing protein n=1 Tax=Thioflavicoccus mobilis 8321 TaxID=765912 RepID=L0GYF1_9GAMM|nr:hypothetical protein [Thioflavicoccus mobilis]AGA90966.1 hypothetical protein Thimo_2219 [Thioflavicoccus mobilis 8321]
MVGPGRRGRLPHLVLAVVAITLFLLTYQWGSQYRHGTNDVPAVAGVRVLPARPLPETLAHPETGNEHLAGPPLTGTWTLMGFADDPQAPMARLVEIYNRLADRPDLRKRLQLVLVASTERGGSVRDFAQLAPAFHLVVGDTALARWRGALDSGDGDTPPALFLSDPDARLTTLFPAAQTPASIADDLRILMSERTR